MTETQLKGGRTTTDPRLDCLPQFDERSREYPIRALVSEQKPLRSRGWMCRTWLDQGQDGACVGFSWTHELAAAPIPIDEVDENFARGIYHDAQMIDEWPGTDYPGTSVLAGAKVISSRGYMSEYRWAFGVEDALRAIGYQGPVVVGIPWYDSMFEPRPSGLLEVSPDGGDDRHAILVRGVSLKARLKGEPGPMELVRLHNSWGKDWGPLDGSCYLRVDDFGRLLESKGECCVPVVREDGPAHAEDELFLSQTGEE